jgi:hypothetical protein
MNASSRHSRMRVLLATSAAIVSGMCFIVGIIAFALVEALVLTRPTAVPSILRSFASMQVIYVIGCLLVAGWFVFRYYGSPRAKSTEPSLSRALAVPAISGISTGLVISSVIAAASLSQL